METNKKFWFEVGKVGEFREAPYTQTLICPRCSVRLLPFGFPGALSRVDNKTEICSECGEDEALLQWGGTILGGTDTWPIKKFPISTP